MKLSLFLLLAAATLCCIPLFVTANNELKLKDHLMNGKSILNGLLKKERYHGIRTPINESTRSSLWTPASPRWLASIPSEFQTCLPRQPITVPPPSDTPTHEPTREPPTEPTHSPTDIPTQPSTQEPSSEPTNFPTHIPTQPPTQEPPGGECDVVCRPGDHYLVNPADCGSFYQCSNGQPIFQPCPGGLIFNPELNVCDWPNSAPPCHPTC